MKTTVQWLDLAKAKFSLSDYALAPRVGVGRGQISKYRNGIDFLSDDVAFRLAALLEIDPAQIIASAHAEKARSSEARAFWFQLSERLSGATSAVCFGQKNGHKSMAMQTHGHANTAQTGINPSVYVVCSGLQAP